MVHILVVWTAYWTGYNSYFPGSKLSVSYIKVYPLRIEVMILINLNYDLNYAQTWFTSFSGFPLKTNPCATEMSQHLLGINTVKLRWAFSSRSFRRKPGASYSKFWLRKIFWVLFFIHQEPSPSFQGRHGLSKLLAGKDSTVHLDVWSKVCIHAGALPFLSIWSCCGCCGHISFLLQHQTDRKGLLSPQQINSDQQNTLKMVIIVRPYSCVFISFIWSGKMFCWLWRCIWAAHPPMTGSPSIQTSAGEAKNPPIPSIFTNQDTRFVDYFPLYLNHPLCQNISELVFS